MKTWLDTLKAEIMMRIAGFILQRHESAWKRWLARMAVRLNLARYGRDPLGFLGEEPGIDHLDYEMEDEQPKTPANPRH